jgi:protein-tyrosine-phosphatase
MPKPIRLLFVSTADHCRSPAALAVATELSRRRGTQHIRFDSAGTARDHVGDLPHPLASHEGGLRGYHLNHVGRQLHPDDFGLFDLIIAMDREIVDDLERLRGGVESRRLAFASVEPVQIQLLRRWDPYSMPGDENLQDPGGRPPSTYAEVFDVIERSMPPLIDHLEWLVAEST